MKPEKFPLAFVSQISWQGRGEDENCTLCKLYSPKQRYEESAIRYFRNTPGNLRNFQGHFNSTKCGTCFLPGKSKNAASFLFIFAQYPLDPQKNLHLSTDSQEEKESEKKKKYPLLRPSHASQQKVHCEDSAGKGRGGGG